jgi:hypothetical protein
MVRAFGRRRHGGRHASMAVPSRRICSAPYRGVRSPVRQVASGEQRSLHRRRRGGVTRRLSSIAVTPAAAAPRRTSATTVRRLAEDTPPERAPRRFSEGLEHEPADADDKDVERRFSEGLEDPDRGRGAPDTSPGRRSAR